MKIVNDHGMLLVDAGFGDQMCLGFLMDFKEKGVFDAHYGKVDVTPEAAAIHNKLLSTALIAGLDTYEVGECGLFYLGTRISDVPAERGWEVKTWTGELVAGVKDTQIRNGVVIFTRGDREFRGRRRKDDDSIFFKRVR